MDNHAYLLSERLEHLHLILVEQIDAPFLFERSQDSREIRRSARACIDSSTTLTLFSRVRGLFSETIKDLIDESLQVV